MEELIVVGNPATVFTWEAANEQTAAILCWVRTKYTQLSKSHGQAIYILSYKMLLNTVPGFQLPNMVLPVITSWSTGITYAEDRLKRRLPYFLLFRHDHPYIHHLLCARVRVPLTPETVKGFISSAFNDILQKLVLLPPPRHDVMQAASYRVI